MDILIVGAVCFLAGLAVGGSLADPPTDSESRDTLLRAIAEYERRQAE